MVNFPLIIILMIEATGLQQSIWFTS